MKFWPVFLACWLGLSGAVAAPMCKVGHAAVVAPCFTVHGQLRAANGTPTFRIWRLGTKRILGVDDGDDNETPWMPAPIKQAFGKNAFDKLVYADFKVCPLSKQKPGWMQFVCITNARHVVVKDAP